MSTEQVQDPTPAAEDAELKGVEDAVDTAAEGSLLQRPNSINPTNSTNSTNPTNTAAQAAVLGTVVGTTPVRRLRTEAVVPITAGECRDAHLKAAVFPAEKREFERMVRTRFNGTKSMSDFLREHLAVEYRQWLGTESETLTRHPAPVPTDDE